MDQCETMNYKVEIDATIEEYKKTSASEELLRRFTEMKREIEDAYPTWWN